MSGYSAPSAPVSRFLLPSFISFSSPSLSPRIEVLTAFDSQMMAPVKKDETPKSLWPWHWCAFLFPSPSFLPLPPILPTPIARPPFISPSLSSFIVVPRPLPSRLRHLSSSSLALPPSMTLSPPYFLPPTRFLPCPVPPLPPLLRFASSSLALLPRSLRLRHTSTSYSCVAFPPSLLPAIPFFLLASASLLLASTPSRSPLPVSRASSRTPCCRASSPCVSSSTPLLPRPHPSASPSISLSHLTHRAAASTAPSLPSSFPIPCSLPALPLSPPRSPPPRPRPLPHTSLPMPISLYPSPPSCSASSTLLLLFGAVMSSYACRGGANTEPRRAGVESGAGTEWVEEGGGRAVRAPFAHKHG
ncbi:hypothetical protein DFH09DRAFT_1455085 [Mycena vulgaris]|nr:hypothetical protein DFH09DRAFT_1455085 [Mycena vulgaris]